MTGFHYQSMLNERKDLADSMQIQRIRVYSRTCKGPIIPKRKFTLENLVGDRPCRQIPGALENI